MKNLWRQLSKIALIAALIGNCHSDSLIAQVVVEAVDAPAQSNAELHSGPLHRYIAKPDDSFGYELAESGYDGGCHWLRYNVTSQTWQSIRWQHVMWLILPTKRLKDAYPVEGDQIDYDITGDSAILFVGGGAWKNEWNLQPPRTLSLPREFGLLSSLATKTQSPIVLLEQVPFQPILDGRFEDAIIAETFRRYLMGEGEDWPLLLPMVKSTVRAMDVTQQQLSERFEIDIERFTVTGASKRGWTTWLTAAVDSRVDAIAPIVIDMLNMPAQMDHQLATWGKYSEEISDYSNLELQKHLTTPRGQALQQIIDPYAYRKALDMPKLLVFGTNDRYWTLDACNLYWKELIGPKNMLYVPNNGHGIKDMQRVLAGLAALHRVRKQHQTLPTIDWSYLESQKGAGKFVVTLNDAKVQSCCLWIAKSKDKDFRKSNWISIPMFESTPGTFTTPIDYADGKHTAFFGEVTIQDQAEPAFLSTNVTIISMEKP